MSPQASRRHLRTQPCAYCGQTPAGSVDHVPPKCFFPEPLPVDLITVPCCMNCNSQFSSEDQYAHSIIAMRRDVQAQPRLGSVHQRLLRGLDRPRALWFRTMLALAMRRGPVQLPSGVWMPDQDYVLIDKQRMLRWVERVVRGLYAFETGAPLPSSLAVTPALGESHPEELATCVGWLRGESLWSAGSGVVEYKWMRCADEPRASVWCIEFYRVVPMLGFVRPIEDAAATEQ